MFSTANHRAAAVLLLAAVIPAAGAAETMQSCRPSPDCALRLARANAGAASLLTEGRILDAIAAHGTREQLNESIARWREEFRVQAPGDPDRWRFGAAHALAIAGRAEEAKALALELGSPDRRTVMVDVAVELAESGRLKDAATAILSLPPEDGPGGAAFELLGQLHGDSRSQPPLRELAQLLKVDADSVSALTAHLIAQSDLARGNPALAWRLAEAEKGTAAVSRLLDFARQEIKAERFESARSFVAKAQVRCDEIKDGRSRRHCLGTVAAALIQARAPREALPLMKNIPPEDLAEWQARLVAQLAWVDLPAARAIVQEIKPRNYWYRSAMVDLVAAEIAASPENRSGLDDIDFPRLKGFALASAAGKLGTSGNKPTAQMLLDEAARFIATDSDSEGRDLVWQSVAETQAQLGWFDAAYATAGKAKSPGYRLKLASEVATAQAKAGDAKSARSHYAAAFSAAHDAGATPSSIADAALAATQAGFVDEAFAALIDVVARDANGRNELDEPNLSAAKQATVVALARAGAMERAFDLATTIGYQPDAAFVALYEVLASQGATVSRLKQ